MKFSLNTKLWFVLITLLSMPATAAAPSNSLDIATTLGSLFFIVVLIIFMGWLLKKMRVPSFGQQKGLSLICHLSVGTKERVMVIQVGEEQYLIGVTPHSVNLLSHLDKPLSTSENLSTQSFSQQLTQLLGKTVSKNDLRFKSLQQERDNTKNDKDNVEDDNRDKQK